MVLRKHWPSFLDNCDSEQTSAGTETDRRTQCDPEHIRNSIEYRLLRLRLSEEKSSCRHAGAACDRDVESLARVAGAPGCAPSTRPHSTCCRRPQRALLARRPASSNHTHRNRNRSSFDEGFASLPSSSRRVCSLRPRTSPRSLLLSGLVDNDDASVALTCARDLDARLRREKEEDAQLPRRVASSRKLTPSICVSPANDDGEDYDVDIGSNGGRNRGVGGEWALEENADGVGNRVATRVLVDHSCLKIPGLTSVPETLAEHDARKPRVKNSSNRKSKVRNRTVSAAKRDGKSKLKGRVRTASSGDGTNRKMALSSTIARTAFQTSSKNCFLDPILHKVTVHIKNYKNPSEKVNQITMQHIPYYIIEFIHACIYIYIYVCVCVCVCVYIYIYTIYTIYYITEISYNNDINSL